MKIRYFVLAFGLVVLFAGVSFAQVVDPPRIIFGGVGTQGGFSQTPSGCVFSDPSTCTASLDANGDANLAITNNTGMTLHQVTVAVFFTGTFNPVDLGSTQPCQISTVEYVTLFGFDTATQTAANACTFSDVPSSGIPNLATYDVDLRGYCTSQPCNGSNSLGAVDFSTTTTPEPGTIVLLGTGLAALMVVGRKRMKSMRPTWTC